jgi:all-trans-8'-apo-beta-carotenal 15,15'-oxygenase
MNHDLPRTEPAQPTRRALLGAAALAACGAGLSSTPAAARPQRAADVAANFEAQPLLRALRGVSDQPHPLADLQAEAQLLGRWPEALRGRFYRNGPALFERGGERYQHWFDGDGMVQQFSIGLGTQGSRVQHRGRLVRTAKLQAEQRAGRFLMDAFGTHVDGGPPAGGPDSFNTANTNALEHAGRVLALWEGGSAYGLDPKDLSTQGPITWRDDAAQVPFSAHPKVDTTGHLWNIGNAGPQLVAWHIDAQGRLVQARSTASPFPGGMVHDMAVTRHWLVVPLPPVKLNFSKSWGEGGRSEGPRPFEMVPGAALRVLVMDKNDLSRQRVFELPPQMVFHVGNAHETPDGQIVLSYVGAPDLHFLKDSAVAMMQGRFGNGAGGASTTCVARLDMRSGRATVQAFDGDVEFPRVDPRRVGLDDTPPRWLLSAAAWREQPGRDGLLHGLQLRDMDSGRTQRFDYGPHQVAEEHVLVPQPGKAGELDAWVLGTTFDARRQATVLNVLDAAHIEDGPIAQAVLPYVLPLGFHGNFTAV